MKGVYLAFCSFLIVLLAACVGDQAERKTLPENHWTMEIPIADAHFHPMPFMTPQQLLKRMDQLNIRWAGGAGAIGDRELPFQNALGDRYLRFAGFNELYRVANSGPKYLADADNKWFENAFGKIEEELRTGIARGIREVLVNTRTSSPNPRMRFKISPNSSGIRALWSLSARYGVPLAIHMQFDPDSAHQLRELLQSDPKGLLVLLHSGVDTVAEQVRPLLSEFSNVFCDLSFRSPPQMKGLVDSSVRIIFSKSGIKPDWKRLIQDFPDRFFVGIDDVYSWSEYDDVASTIREGLLANLAKETAEKVAWKNAVRVFGLK